MLRPIFGIINPLFECHLAAGLCSRPSKGPWPWREKPFPARLCSFTDCLDTVCFNCHCHSHTKPQTWSPALNLEAWLSDSEWEHCSRVHFRWETELIVAPLALSINRWSLSMNLCRLWFMFKPLRWHNRLWKLWNRMWNIPDRQHSGCWEMGDSSFTIYSLIVWTRVLPEGCQ